MLTTPRLNRRPTPPPRAMGTCAARAGALAAALLAAALLGGCVETRVGPGLPGPARPGQDVGVSQLARQLGLTVQQAGPGGATLEGRGNLVCIYPDPAGQIYVNGALVGEGGITPTRDSLTVPGAMVGKISSALRRAPPPPRPPLPRPPVGPGPVQPAPKPTTPLVRQVSGRVVVDAGHGGGDPGAIAPSGMREKHIVLDVARQIAARLRAAGVTVLLTRDGDTALTLEGRAAASNRFAPGLFLSIHADSAKRSSARGFSTYISRSASNGSLQAAAAIERRLLAGGVPAHGNGRHRADYRVLVLTHSPAVLVELGFLTNFADARDLASAAYRARLAGAIADGAVDYLAGK